MLDLVTAVCIHDKIKHEKPVRAVQQYASPYRRTSSANVTASIRIQFDTTTVEQDIGNQVLYQYVKGLLDAAASMLSSAIRVIPIQGNLYVSRDCNYHWVSGQHVNECSSIVVDQTCGPWARVSNSQKDQATVWQFSSGQWKEVTYEQGTGVKDADLLVYVSAHAGDPTCTTSDTALAYSGVCQRDQLDRPVVGYINFCTSTLQNRHSSSPSQSDIMTTVHELTHILGFSRSSFAFFRDENGNPRTPRCPDAASCGPSDTPGYPPFSVDQNNYIVSDSTVQQRQERGLLVSRLVTPTVRYVSQKHYNCNSLVGAELENGGGSGTRLSHWEKRVFMNEYMTGNTYPGSVDIFSSFSLALLQDSGWYEINFDAAKHLKWGYMLGCAFALEKCIQDGKSQTPWCKNSQNDGLVCTYQRDALGYCGLDEYSQDLGASYQYFADPKKGGDDSLPDYCPFYRPYQNAFCSDPQIEINAKCGPGSSSCRGGQYGAETACFESSLWQQGFQMTQGSPLADCYAYRCSKANGKVQLEVYAPDRNWYACSAGVNLSFPSYSGKLYCPNSWELCPSSLNVPTTQLKPMDQIFSTNVSANNEKSSFWIVGFNQQYVTYLVNGAIILAIVAFVVFLSQYASRMWRRRRLNLMSQQSVVADNQVPTAIPFTSHAPTAPAMLAEPPRAILTDYESALPSSSPPIDFAIGEVRGLASFETQNTRSGGFATRNAVQNAC
eukprot:754339-Hanusia_phi.AAC.1